MVEVVFLWLAIAVTMALFLRLSKSAGGCSRRIWLG
jgi:hypothetical protein